MVLCNAQQTAGQAQQWMWHGDREEALDKNMPSQPVFPWQTSMQAQLQGIITDVAEVQTSRGKVREPAGLHRFAVQTDNCQDKDKRGAGIYSWDLQPGSGDQGQGRGRSVLVDPQREEQD